MWFELASRLFLFAHFGFKCGNLLAQFLLLLVGNDLLGECVAIIVCKELSAHIF